MKIGILGTGTVGEALATALVNKGHNVMMGSRMASNEKIQDWIKRTGKGALAGTFQDAAGFGDLLFICLNGEFAADVVRELDPERVAGKIVIDITNPLDFTQGNPPRILEEYTNISLGETIQQLLPTTFVVKTLNTVNYRLMIDAREVNDGHHDLFLCGNDPTAKNQVKHFLVDNFHWRPESLIDLGDIKSARTMEAIVPFWVLVYRSIGTPLFNFKIVH
jgi:8-hydroxy-5-deazaflavin:NADPH oxidoreductase